MGAIPASEKETITLAEAVAMSLVERAGLTQFDNRGDSSFLAAASAGNEITYRMHVARQQEATDSALVSLRSQAALGTFREYTWTYADVSLNPTILSFAAKGVSPVPKSEGQMILMLSGMTILPSVGWRMSQTGIVLSAPLEAGQFIDLIVLSPALSNLFDLFVYRGSDGTGVGNKVFTMDDLGPDMYGNTVFRPATADKLWVLQNGQYKINTVGFTYSAGVVTFLVDLLADEYITFVVWSV